jgi:hypothetical protein
MKNLKNILEKIMEDERRIPNALDGTFFIEYFSTNSINGKEYNVELRLPGEKVSTIYKYANIKTSVGNRDISQMIINGLEIAKKLGLANEKDNKSDLVVTDGKIASINGYELETPISVKHTLDSKIIDELRSKINPEKTS